MNFLFKLKRKLETMFFEEKVGDFLLQKIKLKNSKELLLEKISVAIKLNESQGVKEIFNLLNDEFNFVRFKYLGIDAIYIDHLSQLIYKSQNSTILKKEYDSILNDFSSIPPNSLSVCDWDKAVFICNFYGLFKLSGVCRKKAADYITERYECDQKTIHSIAMFKVCLDFGDYEKASEIINKIVSRNDSHYVKYLHDNFFNYKDKNKVSLSKLDKNQEKFLELINDKNIAIVAPGLIDINEGIINEINSFDLIIYFNYKGLKIDDRFTIPFLSYYNGESSYNLRSIFESFSDDLVFSVFKSKDLQYKENLVKGGRAKYIDRDLSKLFFSQSPNMLQIILDDILKYNSNKIKVFGVNFYLSDKIYFDGYNNSLDLANTRRSLSYHNILSQVNYVRNLYNIGVLELEQSTIDIINMDEVDLLGAFESIYSNIER